MTKKIIIQKFGGTSVSSVEAIFNVAKKIKAELENGNAVAVVVSAMAGVTDQLINLTTKASGGKQKHEMNNSQLAEYDSILSSGEQVSSGLLAIALESIGIKSRSYTGWQLPIEAKGVHSRAEIDKIHVESLMEDVKNDVVPIISGFQGVNEFGRVMTLGRGGSDISAVALTVALKAERCDIYTDVDGVFTTDPKITNKATKIKNLTFDEMLQMSSHGAKVLHERAAQIARNHNLNLRILSSFSNSSGTLIFANENSPRPNVIGIACKTHDVAICLKNLKNEPGKISQLFSLLSQQQISTDIIVQTIAKNNQFVDITITIPESQLACAEEILLKNQLLIGFSEILIEKSVSQISVIGSGIGKNQENLTQDNSSLALKIFDTLAQAKINIKIISSAEMKISLIICDKDTKKAIESLHDAFGLEQQDLAKANNSQIQEA